MRKLIFYIIVFAVMFSVVLMSCKDDSRKAEPPVQGITETTDSGASEESPVRNQFNPEWLIAGVILFSGVYSFVFFIMNRHDRLYFYIGIMFFAVAMSTLFLNGKVQLWVMFVLSVPASFLVCRRFFMEQRKDVKLFTEIRLASDKLKKSKNFLKSISNSINAMLISLNEQGKINFSNSLGEKNLPFINSGNASHALWKSAELSESIAGQLKDAFLNNKPLKVKSARLLRDNDRFFNISLSPIVEEKTKGAVIRIDDVTQEVKNSTQLLNIEKMETIGTLAGGLAHDFNNNLTGIIGTISLIRQSLRIKENSPQKMIDRLKLINLSAARSVNLVNQLKTLSKKQEFTCSGVDLNQTIRNVMDICSNTFEKDIDIIISYFNGDAYVYADAVQIEQAFLNICVNAAHSMTIMRPTQEKKGGRLSVSIRRIDGDSVELMNYPVISGSQCWAVDVTDTGVGMDEGTIKKIFKPFFTTKDQGTGLGLVMVNNIIQQHGGVIEVKSEKNVGTAFKVILSAYQPFDIQRDQVKTELSLKGSGLIILAEDYDVLRFSTADILKTAGYQVLLAQDGEQTLTLARKRYPELKGLVINMTLPHMHINDLYKGLKKIRKDIRVIITSGVRIDPEFLNDLRADGNGLLEKPYSMEALLNKCKEIFKGSEG